MYLWKSTMLLSKFCRFFGFMAMFYADKELWIFSDILEQVLFLFSQLIFGKVYSSSKKYSNTLPINYKEQTEKEKQELTNISHSSNCICQYVIPYKDFFFYWIFIRLHSCYFDFPWPTTSILKWEWNIT